MVFLSYSHADIVSAREVEKRLRDAGIACWFDEIRIPVGQRFVTEIGQALRAADAFFAIDSEAAAASYWVKRELQAAQRLRSHNGLGAIVVFSASAAHFLPCEPDARVSSMDLVAKTVESLTAGSSPRPARSGMKQPEAVEILDRLEEEAFWLGFSQELRLLDDWWFGTHAGLWITGPGGSGKTSLVRTWARAFQQIGYRDDQRAVAMFMYIHRGEANADVVFGQLIDDFAGPLRIYDVDSRSSREPIEHRLATFQYLVRDRHDAALLVMNDAESIDAQELRKVLRGVLGAGLRVIVTARNSLPREFEWDFESIALSEMSAEHARLLFARVLPGQETAPAVTQLIDALSRHPLALSLAADHIRKGHPLQTNIEAAEDLLRWIRQDAAGGYGGEILGTDNLLPRRERTKEN